MNLYNLTTKLFDKLTGKDELKRTTRRALKALNYANSMDAAARGGFYGVQSNGDEDAANKEALAALPEVLQRSQDLDNNNPDLFGFHRTRVAQIIGAGVKFRSAPNYKELGITTDQAQETASKIDLIRELHSSTGGFDCTNKRI